MIILIICWSIRQLAPFHNSRGQLPRRGLQKVPSLWLIARTLGRLLRKRTTTHFFVSGCTVLKFSGTHYTRTITTKACGNLAQAHCPCRSRQRRTLHSALCHSAHQNTGLLPPSDNDKWIHFVFHFATENWPNIKNIIFNSFTKRPTRTPSKL